MKLDYSPEDTFEVKNVVKAPPGSPLVSLIIPVYNAAEYLSQTLRSVSSQTRFSDMQVIIIDDGSQDDSYEICARFAAVHENVELYRQANSGAAVARNNGLDLAKGKYIAFLDSDDRMPPNSIDRRVRAMRPWTDVVIGNMQTFPVVTTWPWSKDIGQGDRTVNIVEAPRLLSGAGPCNKLFRAEIFANGSNRFAVGRRFEDAFAVIPILLQADKISLISETVYNYRKRIDGSSLMDELWTNSDSYFDHLALEAHVLEAAQGMSRSRRKAAQMFAIRSIAGFFARASSALSSEELLQFFQEAHQIYKHMPPALVFDIISNTRHRVLFFAVMTNNFHLFSDPENAEWRVETIGGRLRIVPTCEVPLEYAPFFTPSKTPVFLEASYLHDGKIRFSGSVRIPGIAATPTVELNATFMAQGESISSVRPVSIRKFDHDTDQAVILQWTSDVNPELVQDTDILSARFSIFGEQIVLPCQYTAGLLRSSKPLQVENTILQVLPAPKYGTKIRKVSGSAGGVARVRWSLARAKDDMQAAKSRKPYWKWRVLRLVISPFLRKPRFVFGERSDTAQDNGWILFEWARRSRSEIAPRYVLDADSIAWQNTQDKKGLVKRNSLRHKLLMITAKAVISSQDIESYLLPESWKKSVYRLHLLPSLNQYRIFLQHGVIHNGLGKQVHRRGTGYDMFVCSSTQELEYLRQWSGYKDELKLTGMPRLDAIFESRSGEKSREILLLPTWRSYLVAPSFASDVNVTTDDFTSSDYATFYGDFLQSDRLLEVLDRHNLTLRFVPHYESAKYFEVLTASDRITIDVDGSSHIPDLIRSTPLLITDYSSVAFDAAFAGAAVVLAHFDLEEFYERHYSPGWYNPELGVGAPAKTLEGVLDLIDDYAACEFHVDEALQARVDSFFAHHDQSNRERTFEEIVKLVSRS
ncbi:bifunctional glycosyltransferase/CDP-glycerol:glycerophosphate glycerophosphotransferase [Leucobacter sp. HY1908]